MITKEDLETLGIEVLSCGTGLESNQIRCVCNNPGCKDLIDKKGRMYVNSESGLYYCFRCGNKGKISLDKNRLFNNKYLLEKISGELLEEHNIQIGGIDYTEEEREKMVIPYNESLDRKEYLELCKDLGKHPDIYKYAISRGITNEEMDRYKIRFCIKGKYYNRFIVPVFEEKKMRTFIARYAGKSNIKYLHPGGLNIDDVVFFSRYPSDILVITEGILDAISCDRCGYSSAALLGKNPKKQRLKKIKKLQEDLGLELIFYYDADVLFGSGYSIHTIFDKVSQVFNTDNIHITCPRDFSRDPGDSTCRQVRLDIENREKFSDYRVLSTQLSKISISTKTI